MAKDEDEDLLPDKDAAKGFYAKYEPKEVLGRWVRRSERRESHKYSALLAFFVTQIFPLLTRNVKLSVIGDVERETIP